MSNAYTKNKGRESYPQTYLDLVDELRSNEECHFPFKMNSSERDLVVVVPQSITLVLPSACQIRENQPIRQTNEIYKIQKRKGNKKSLRRRYSLNQTPQSRDEGELPHKNALSLLACLPFLHIRWLKKNARYILNEAQYGRVAMPIIKSSKHPQDTQKNYPRRKISLLKFWCQSSMT